MNNCARPLRPHPPIRPQSLSVVLPVRNAERTLTTRVVELLEVLPDLAGEFEVMIVDDGSTDQTDEVAVDLARCYPQVKFARHNEPQGVEASARTGIEHTSGEVVIVHAGSQPVSARELEQMWQTREDEQLVVSQCDGLPGPVSHDVIQKLTDWGQRVATRDDAHGGEQAKRPARRRASRTSQVAGAVPTPNFGFAASPPASPLR